MKINAFQSLMAVALSALMAYGFFTFPDNENVLLLGVGSFFLLSITLVLTIASEFKERGKTIAFRTSAGVFFSILFLSNFIFSFTEFDAPYYFVINGVIFLSFLSLNYTISKRDDRPTDDY